MVQNINLGMKCIKYMLFISNFMFVMVGVLLISFGSTIKSIYYDFEIFMEDHYFSPAKLTVAIGIIILLTAAFGCFAAIKESTCMVNVYALLLCLVLILEVSASIAAYSMRSNIEVYLQDNMVNAMRMYKSDSESQTAVDNLQQYLNCCGVQNEEEWYSYTNSSRLPRSCCHPDVSFNYPSTSDKSCKVSGLGCLDALAFIVRESSIMLGTGALCIAIVQVLGIIFSIMLAKSIRRIKTEREVQNWQNRQQLYLQLARGSEKPAAITPVTYSTENNSSEA